MSKLDELERMVQEAKREEAERSGGAWMGYLFLIVILIAFVRGCSGDKTNNSQEQPPKEESSVPVRSDTKTTENYSNTASDETTVEKHEASPEEKLESMTGEKIDPQPEAIEETVFMPVNEQEGNNN
jgi:hypothetical protein